MELSKADRGRETGNRLTGEFSAARIAVGSAIIQSLKGARESKGLSLDEISASTGIVNSLLAEMESGANGAPSIDLIARYAEVVGKRTKIRVADA